MTTFDRKSHSARSPDALLPSIYLSSHSQPPRHRFQPWIEICQIWSTDEPVRNSCSVSHIKHPTTHPDSNLAYKNKSGAYKADELRRRREEQQVEIRRQKREENISKRRNLATSSGPDSDDEATGPNFDAPVSNPLRPPHSTDFLLISMLSAGPGDGRRRVFRRSRPST